uniref:Secreted protein n=1 Tax=Anguilla anguilla TaxID=7936 RepID=A0A0E9X746_ANGAN
MLFVFLILTCTFMFFCACRAIEHHRDADVCGCLPKNGAIVELNRKLRNERTGICFHNTQNTFQHYH